MEKPTASCPRCDAITRGSFGTGPHGLSPSTHFYRCKACGLVWVDWVDSSGKPHCTTDTPVPTVPKRPKANLS